MNERLIHVSDYLIATGDVKALGTLVRAYEKSLPRFDVDRILMRLMGRPRRRKDREIQELHERLLSL
jgi:hypothetical protein